MRREENQDSHLIFQTDRFHCLIVADGMGGAQGGATASSMALKVFKEFLTSVEEVNEESIAAAIREANRSVYAAGTSDPTLMGMGTTFVGICFVGNSAYFFNVGDSRIYRIRNGRIQALTEDHTLIMDLIRSGAISPDQADNHPVSHMLTRSLGPAEDVVPDCWLCEDGPARGDRYIICSDGLYNMVSDVVMLRIAGNNSLEVARDECIRLANENGGTDNITVIVVEIGDSFPVGPEEFDTMPEVDTEEDTMEIRISPEDLVGVDEVSEEPTSNGTQLEGGGEQQSDGHASPEIASNISLEVQRTFGTEEAEGGDLVDSELVLESEPSAEVEEVVSSADPEEAPELEEPQEEGESEDVSVDDLDMVEAVVEDVEEEELAGEGGGHTPRDEPEEVELSDSLAEAIEEVESHLAPTEPTETVGEETSPTRSRPITLLLVFCFGVAATLCSGLLYQYVQKQKLAGVGGEEVQQHSIGGSSRGDKGGVKKSPKAAEKKQAKTDKKKNGKGVKGKAQNGSQEAGKKKGEQRRKNKENARGSKKQAETETANSVDQKKKSEDVSVAGQKAHEEKGDDASGDTESAPRLINGLPIVRASEISHRKRYIRQRISTLEGRLLAFDKPITGGVGARFDKVSRKLEKSREQFGNLRKQIEETSREVSLWYGRQRRLQNTDHVSLASEIAGSSAAVKKAKSDFEKATWEYLKQAESLRYDPENGDLKGEVDTLTVARRESLKNLREVVSSAIHEQSEKAHARMNELTTRRDRTQQRIVDLEEDLRYLKALTGTGGADKAKLKKEFKLQLEVAKSELAELNLILPRKFELPG
jgi:protein phosphatase